MRVGPQPRYGFDAGDEPPASWLTFHHAADAADFGELLAREARAYRPRRMNGTFFDEPERRVRGRVRSGSPIISEREVARRVKRGELVRLEWRSA